MAEATGKERAGWIPSDYFKRLDPLERWKLRLSGIALLGVAVWWGTGFLWSTWGDHRASRGPVASVHATWETKCAACHVPFRPIRGDSWIVSGQDSDRKCQVCHAGPPHHLNQIPDLACASCHREHQGREASLVRIPDSACTQCHTNLNDHMTESDFHPPVAAAVTRFDRAHHPQDFASVKGDPGKLKFNHQLHMSLGMDTQMKGDPKLTLAKIPEPDRNRYRRAGQSVNDRVLLECASCHCLDSGDFQIQADRLAGVPLSAILPVRTAGSYMLPITYENQCRPCHPLTTKVLDDPGSPEVAVPHRLQPDQIHNFLWGFLANHNVEEKVKGRSSRTPPRMPGKDRISEDEQARLETKTRITRTEKKSFRDKVEAMESLLFSRTQTCGECHFLELQNGKPLPKAIKPTQVPQVWFQRAVFNHKAHRAVDCRECHARAYADHPDASSKSQDVLLPKIQTCARCHAISEASSGGARFDCVECHRYHHGAASPGEGASAGNRKRDPGSKLSIEQFLFHPR